MVPSETESMVLFVAMELSVTAVTQTRFFRYFLLGFASVAMLTKCMPWV